MNQTSSITLEGIEKPVSKLALGTAFFRLESRDAWFNILDCFCRERGTVVDTGRIYGESEQVIGSWLESRRARDQVILITKGGHGTGHGLSAEDFLAVIKRELTTSLETLGTEYVDLYMLHRDSPTVPVATIMDCLNRELDRGSIRALGASNWEYPRIDEANEYAQKHGLRGFSAGSNNLSLAVPTGPFYPGLVSVDRDGERWHGQTGIPLIPWSSQARGFFTGQFTREMRAMAHEIQDGFVARMVEVYGTDDNFERLRRAADLGKKMGGFSATQIALSCLLHKSFPVIPIVGPRTGEELTSCLQAASLVMTRRETEWLRLENENHMGH